MRCGSILGVPVAGERLPHSHEAVLVGMGLSLGSSSSGRSAETDAIHVVMKHCTGRTCVVMAVCRRFNDLASRRFWKPLVSRNCTDPQKCCLLSSVLVFLDIFEQYFSSGKFVSFVQKRGLR